MMLPTDSFIYDTAEHEPERGASAPMIPLAPRLNAHIYPHDYFHLKTSSGHDYIGEYIDIQQRSAVPAWQQPSSLSCGEPVPDLALFRVILPESVFQLTNEEEARLLKVPYEDLSKCIGLRQVYLTNAYVWLPISSITDIAIITHGEVIQNSYCQFGGKGVCNSYFILHQIRYCMNKFGEVELTSSVIHHSQFSSFARSDSPSFLHPPSYNHRIYTALGSLRTEINKLMHTKRMFQRNGYTMNHYLSAECWQYLCARLRGGCAIVDGEVDRVRRLFLSDLAQEKKKFHAQHLTTIQVETQEELIHVRRVFGASFCVGARCAPKVSDGVLPVKTGSAINAVWPPSGTPNTTKITKKRKRATRKCDTILIKFDHATSIAAVTVVFTRLIVGQDEEVIDILKSIGHNELIENLVVIDIDVGMEFVHNGQRMMIEEINGDMVTASNSDDEILCLHKNDITCL